MSTEQTPETTAATTLDSAKCNTAGCGFVGPTSLFCKRGDALYDSGPNWDFWGYTARYHGTCLRCCDHNHG